METSQNSPNDLRNKPELLKKGLETLQDVNGFLQVRMAGMQKQQEESVEEEGRRKKPSLPILHARCASRSQRDETHRVE